MIPKPVTNLQLTYRQTKFRDDITDAGLEKDIDWSMHVLVREWLKQTFEEYEYPNEVIASKFNNVERIGLPPLIKPDLAHPLRNPWPTSRTEMTRLTSSAASSIINAY